MWIRSQDKTILIKVKEVYISNNYLKNQWLKELYKNEPTILEYSIKTNTMKNLGTYTTKEKAMKVLDTIQNNLNNNRTIVEHCGNEYYISPFEKAVFQMPQDNEV